MDELISIIIPIYNSEKYLEECLNSVAKQTYPKFEVILVDDGSTDSSSKICDKFASTYENFHVIHKNNEGVAKARIDAFYASKGSFITFVDSDDYIDEKYLTTLKYKQNEHDADVVLCQFREFDDKKYSFVNINPQPDTYNKNKINEILKHKFLYDSDTESSGIPGYLWGKLIKRKYVEKMMLLGDGLIYCEDKLGVFYLLNHIDSMDVISDVLYHYRKYSNQTTNRYNQKFWDSFESFFQRIQLEDKSHYLKKQIPFRAFMELKMLVEMEFKNQSIDYFSRIEQVKSHLHSPLFEIPFTINISQVKRKRKVKFWLLKHKCINIYAVIMYFKKVR